MPHIEIDEHRGREAARILYHAFNSQGIFGENNLPENIMPEGVAKGSPEHVLFITMTVSIDYRRDAAAMWRSAKATYEDEEIRYLFDPGRVSRAPLAKVIEDMRKYRLSMKPIKDALIWKTIGTSFARKWDGNPINLLKSCSWDAEGILKRLNDESHEEESYEREEHEDQGHRKKTSDFPYLRGDKIGPLWIRMLKDNCRVSEIQGLERCPMPVDVHVARATINLGVVKAKELFQGRMEVFYLDIRRAWFRCVEGLQVDGRPMMALDVNNPLWCLSKRGCSKRTKEGRCKVSEACPVKDLCLGKDAFLVQGERLNLLGE